MYSPDTLEHSLAPHIFYFLYLICTLTFGICRFFIFPILFFIFVLLQKQRSRCAGLHQVLSFHLNRTCRCITTIMLPSSPTTHVSRVLWWVYAMGEDGEGAWNAMVVGWRSKLSSIRAHMFVGQSPNPKSKVKKQKKRSTFVQRYAWSGPH